MKYDYMNYFLNVKGNDFMSIHRWYPASRVPSIIASSSFKACSSVNF